MDPIGAFSLVIPILVCIPLAGIAALAGFGMWWIFLGRHIDRVGWAPLRRAYLWFLLGLAATSFSAGAGLGFPLVFAYALAIGLVLLGAIGVPMAALLVRWGFVSYRLAGVIVVGVIVAVAVIDLITSGELVRSGTRAISATLLEWTVLIGPPGAGFAFGLVAALKAKARRMAPPPASRPLAALSPEPGTHAAPPLSRP